MIKLGHTLDLKSVKKLPSEVMEVISNNLEILDEEYGEHRNIFKDLGGYIVITTNESEQQEVNDLINADLAKDAIPEYVDIIRCKTKEVYTVSLFLCGSDFGIIVIMPYSITPRNLLNYVD